MTRTTERERPEDAFATKISVVTPTFEEAANLAARAAEIASQTGPWEWIVADGGSRDGSAAIARGLGASVVTCERGRGPQLNAGAARADGDVLLFLHADTALPPDAFASIRAALRETQVVGGRFSFAFDDASLAGRVLGFIYAAKGALFGVWYGDSAIFVRTSVFRALGGFAPFPILEDADFVARLRRLGPTPRLASIVRSSPRRYRGRVLATLARWIGIFTLYKLGVSPYRLARFYAPHDSREQHLRGRRDSAQAAQDAQGG